ncbi:hypothetical protein CPLU01_11103 [Colletotrichum plurivorum]|uniref:Uncharacterized protein n=1 Tax=Colletotrichum plurivorum TaxID=2175906 RepID=A0A8H6N939_9PEZI|nr:hypothetical protein CPLU01_11103 [Colletotrichum plurivorum]
MNTLAGPTGEPPSSTAASTKRSEGTSSSAAPTTFLCGAEDSYCGSCEEKSKVKPRQVEEGDEAVLDEPGLTSPLEWAAGFQDWFNRMYRIMEDYCKGLKEPRTLPSGKRIQMGYSTMNADEFGDKPLMGGTGPLWGCSALVIVTDHGIYTSHNWEVPNFQVPGGVNDPDSPYFGMDLAAEYKHSVRDFLHDGDWDRDYVGLTYLRRNTRIFNSRVKKAFIFTPRAGAFYLAVPFPPEHGLGTDRSPNTLHDAKVREWDGILREAFLDANTHDPDFVQVRAYVKGPSYWQPWPGPPNPPMTNYEPPYGLVHWQYHPSHVRVDNGVEIRQAGIRLWYEQFLMWEHFWDLPAAPGSPEATATEGSESASASEGAGQPTVPAGPIVIPPTNQTSKVALAPIVTSSTSSLSLTTAFVLPPTSSKTPVATVVVTATASETVTSWDDTTSTVVIGGPSGSSSTVTDRDDTTSMPLSQSSTATDSQTTTTRPPFVINNPPKSDRAVLISQEIRFNESTHMAVASVYEYNDEGNVSAIVVEGRASDAGGHVKLPSELLLKDNWGGQLRVNFTQAFFDIEFESKMGSRIQSWGLYTEKDPDDEGAGWCKVDKTAVNLETITRKIECRYTA